MGRSGKLCAALVGAAAISVIFGIVHAGCGGGGGAGGGGAPARNFDSATFDNSFWQ